MLRLAIKVFNVFNSITMLDPESFDPYSQNELISLLPDRCTDCNFAALVIALARINPSRSGGLAPMDRIRDIEAKCTGYEGPDPDSDMYAEELDRSGCPYALLLRQQRELP